MPRSRCRPPAPAAWCSRCWMATAPWSACSTARRSRRRPPRPEARRGVGLLGAAGDELAQLGLGLEAHGGADHLAALEQQQGGDAHHTVFLGGGGVVIDI